MKFLSPRARRLAETRAITAALTVARQFEWAFDRTAPVILGPTMQTFLYIDSAQLLLIPSIDHTGSERGQVEMLMREARCDALLVKVGRARDGQVQVFAQIVLWSRRGNRWTGSHIPWAGEGGELLFAPDPNETYAEPAWFAMRNDRIVSILPPCSNDREFADGIARARTLFADLDTEF